MLNVACEGRRPLLCPALLSPTSLASRNLDYLAWLVAGEASGSQLGPSWVCIRLNPQVPRTHALSTPLTSALSPPWISVGDRRSSGASCALVFLRLSAVPRPGDDRGGNVRHSAVPCTTVLALPRRSEARLV